MGNLAVANIKKRVEGGRQKVVCDITFSAAYATNGDSFLAADLENLFGKAAEIGINGAGGADIDTFTAEIALADGTEAALDRVNKKLKAFSGRAEVANATDLHLAVCRCEFALRAAATG